MRFRSNRIIPQRISQASALIVIAEFMPERVLEKERERQGKGESKERAESGMIIIELSECRLMILITLPGRLPKRS